MKVMKRIKKILDAQWDVDMLNIVFSLLMGFIALGAGITIARLIIEVFVLGGWHFSILLIVAVVTLALCGGCLLFCGFWLLLYVLWSMKNSSKMKEEVV